MRPVSFSDREVVYAKDQPPYSPLPAERWEDGTVVTKWRMTWRERVMALVSGHVFLAVRTFGQPLQPLRMATDRPVERSGDYEL